MSRIYLQDMVEDIQFDDLPANWSAFDIRTFSHAKTLWDYQQKAVENAIKALWKFYEDLRNYRAGDDADANPARKRKFFQWYQDNGLNADLDIPLAGNHRLAGLLSEYYPFQDDKISYDEFINRACF